MDAAPKGYDSLTEHLNLRATYQSHQEVQRKLEKLEQLKGRMGRFMKVCNEKIGQIGKEHLRGTHGEYKLDIIYEQHDDHEMRSLGRQVSKELHGAFTPIDRDSSVDDSANSRNELARLSRFSDASEVANKHSASGFQQSNKKRDGVADLFRASETGDRPSERPRRGTSKSPTAAQRGTAAPISDSPDTISQLHLADNRNTVALVNHTMYS